MTDSDQETGLRYDRMVEDALRGVVRQALTYVCDNGLPGEHHFYITFRTDYPGVDIPAHLHERYPSEMTIVLQYQYWDLQVEPDYFEVTLSFADVPEQLHIPYDAVVSFADPAVRFGLQFESGEEMDEEGEETIEFPGQGDGEDAGELAQDEGKPAAEKSGDKASKEDGGEESSEDTGDGDEKVVTLDKFRKKQT
ncbi:MAG: ClpXP protease specificity-enhancing factor SspB [Rhodovibrionaceae bacterium]|nr:ClpXP protease specificity-enhancing factor SspB [Rhodovibrionaceae bacterium]